MMFAKATVWVASAAMFWGGSLVEAGEVARWDFDDLVGGTTLEDLVGTIDGVQGGVGVSVTASGAGVPGATGFNNAYDFDGNSNSVYVNMGTTTTTSAISNFGAGAFSIAGWFDADERNSGSSNYRWILGNIGASGGFVVHLGRPTTASSRGKLHVQIGGGADQITFQSADRYDLTGDLLQWHWFAATSDGSTLTVYVDGTRLGSVPYLPGTTATPDVGSTALLGRAFDGRIDQLSIWDHQLGGTLNGNDLTGGELYDLWQQSVPEPASVALLAIGGLVCLPRRSVIS
jgi:hypothetical protein